MLHRKVTEYHLFEIFQTYGTVEKVVLCGNREDNFHRRTTNDFIVVFSDETCAKNALIMMNDGLVDGKSLRVRFENDINNHEGTYRPCKLKLHF